MYVCKGSDDKKWHFITLLLGSPLYTWNGPENSGPRTPTANLKIYWYRVSKWTFIFFKSVFYNTIFVGIYIETQKLVENCENIQIFYEYNDNNNNKKKIPGFKGIISHKVNSAAGVVTAQISDNNGLIFAENFRACPENCKITMTCVGVWKFCTVMMSIVLGCNFQFYLLFNEPLSNSSNNNNKVQTHLLGR